MFFDKIVHWSGVVFHAVISAFHTAETKADDVAPKLEKALQEGATIASLIPVPLASEVSAALNLGVELVGAVDKALHYTDESFQKMVQDAQNAIPPQAEQAVVLVPQVLLNDAKAFLAGIKAQADAIKAEANKIAPNGAPAAQK